MNDFHQSRGDDTRCWWTVSNGGTWRVRHLRSFVCLFIWTYQHHAIITTHYRTVIVTTHFTEQTRRHRNNTKQDNYSVKASVRELIETSPAVRNKNLVAPLTEWPDCEIASSLVTWTSNIARRHGRPPTADFNFSVINDVSLKQEVTHSRRNYKHYQITLLNNAIIFYIL